MPVIGGADTSQSFSQPNASRRFGMLRRTFVKAVAAAGSGLAAPALALAQSDPGTPIQSSEGNAVKEAAPQTGYAPVNGLQMYYEIHGEASGDQPPLVLLHGAFATIDLWGPILETLAGERQVIAVELQAHGHTADIDRPFSYERFADDVAVVMEHLAIAQADVVGYSMGANTGLRLAIQHPDRVRKLVAISGNYRTDGYYPELLGMIQSLTPEMFAGSPVEDAYLRNAPNPEDFPKLVEKMKEFEANLFAWPAEDVQAIAAPTLLIIADSDGVRPEHAVEMFRLLGGGVPGDLTGLPKSQLAIIPGATHVSLVVERSDLWLPMVAAFLDAPMPPGQ
jgi:pimeloyl-ACP methyl ester carboxylesterase